MKVREHKMFVIVIIDSKDERNQTSHQIKFMNKINLAELDLANLSLMAGRHCQEQLSCQLVMKLKQHVLSP